MEARRAPLSSPFPVPVLRFCLAPVLDADDPQIMGVLNKDLGQTSRCRTGKFFVPEVTRGREISCSTPCGMVGNLSSAARLSAPRTILIGSCRRWLGPLPMLLITAWVMIGIDKGRPWLHVLFRTVFGCFRAHGRTPDPLSTHYGDGWGIFCRARAFGTSNDPVVNLSVWPWPLPSILMIVGSRHLGQGSRQNVVTGIG